MEGFKVKLGSSRSAKRAQFCPPKYEVPIDGEGYIQAFSVEESKEINEFFEKFGFVVVRDVLTKEECDATIDDMWNFLVPVILPSLILIVFSQV